MSLNFNGINIENAYFNGVELNKIYFNNILIFKKILEPSYYLRRIMPDDNLTNKVIYGNFTPNLQNMISTNGEVIRIVWTVDNDEMPPIFEFSSSGNASIFIGNTSTPLWEYYSNTEHIHTPKTINNDFYVSGVANQKASYRCLYIEDENIRPIQLGDKIGPQTVFYFNFPDDLAQKNIPSSDYLVKFSDWAYIISEKNESNIAISSKLIKPNSVRTLYKCTALEPLTITTNTSTVSCDAFNDEEPQEVISLNSDFSQYILVDTRTLWN